jgi:hypothetical protein
MLPDLNFHGYSIQISMLPDLDFHGYPIQIFMLPDPNFHAYYLEFHTDLGIFGAFFF